MKYTNLSSVLFASILISGLFSSCNEKAKRSEDNSNVTVPSGRGLYADSASSSVQVFDQNGKVCIQQSNTTYEVVNAVEGKDRIPLLLKIKKTELCVADSVNKHKVYEISAKSVLDSKKVAWDAKFVATNIEFKNGTMITTHEGADGEEDFIRMFSTLDGKEVFSCSYGSVNVTIPNVKEKWYIGFTSRNAASNPIKEMNEENLIGLIHYGSSAAAINGFKVKLKRTKVAAKIPSSTPDMVLLALNGNNRLIEDGKTLILMKADERFQPADFKDFSVKFTFYYGEDNESTDITIPIVNDKLDLAGAKYDKDIFELQDMK